MRPTWDARVPVEQEKYVTGVKCLMPHFESTVQDIANDVMSFIF